MQIYAILGIMVILSAAGTWGWGAWTDYETRLINQGVAQCAGAVNKAEHEKLESEFAGLQARMAEQIERTKQVEAQRDEARASSASQHAEIETAMQANACTIPDKAVDAVNAPIKKAAPIKLEVKQ